MTVFETIKTLLQDYPRLYKNRMDVLYHLFCVIGNGYDWKDGDLVDVSGYQKDRPSEYTIDAEANYQALVDFYQNQMSFMPSEEKLRKEATDNQQHALYLQENIDQIVNTTTPLLLSTYPLSEEYSSLMNIPEDINQDWAQAAEELAKALIVYHSASLEDLQDGFRQLSTIHWMNLDQINKYVKQHFEDQKANLPLAEKALQKIHLIKQRLV